MVNNIRLMCSLLGTGNYGDCEMSEWIKCSERMPKNDQEVLVYRPDAPETDDPLMRTAFYSGKGKYGFRHGFSCLCQPSHWMPLPEPPTD